MHTLSVEPGNVDSLVVSLPEGAYPFVGTYPGHGSIRYGVIYATNKPKRLPLPDQNFNIPDRMADVGHQHHHATLSAHLYTLRLPAVYRTSYLAVAPQ